MQHRAGCAPGHFRRRRPARIEPPAQSVHPELEHADGLLHHLVHDEERRRRFLPGEHRLVAGEKVLHPLHLPAHQLPLLEPGEGADSPLDQLEAGLDPLQRMAEPADQIRSQFQQVVAHDFLPHSI